MTDTPLRSIAAILYAACEPGPIPLGVVHPVDASTLGAVQEAEALGLIHPVLVGPRARIQRAAEEQGVDISRWPLHDTEHSHAAAERAVQLARAGQVAALMKGGLSTDELMAAAVQRDGIRSDRRMSHIFVMEVPTYPKLLLITDAAINIAPSLAEKRDILQNAIDLAHALGIERPKAAILAAVEKVKPQMPSTIDAAALCKMTDRDQITGALVDGPLAFDNAISREAADAKGIRSEVAGDADILLTPDLESGNMVAKQLSYLASAKSAAIVLGARVPIVLTSRAEGHQGRLASVALAVLFHHHSRAAHHE